MNLRQFQGRLGAYQEIITDDGQTTLYSEFFAEACHSLSGAMQETLTHYVQGCDLIHKAQTQDHVSILEVGFGRGIGFLATKMAIKENNIQTPIRFVSLELDDLLVEWVKNHSGDDYLKNMERSNFAGCDSYYYKSPSLEIAVLLGDARKTIKNLIDNQYKFDCIYQDAFSPKQNPALWTTEWFLDLKSISNADVILSTYSSAVSMRKSLHEAGWKINTGKKFGKKKESTIAKLSGETAEEILSKMSRSPLPPLRDL